MKDFYFRLSEILRGYLGERYGFEALECTSSELMAKLRRMPTPGLPEDGLLRFVSESDLVKFARAESSPDSCRAALAFGYELLDKTWPPPPPPEAVPVSHASGPHDFHNPHVLWGLLLVPVLLAGPGGSGVPGPCCASPRRTCSPGRGAACARTCCRCCPSCGPSR